MQARFVTVAKELANNEAKINEELIAVQGQPMNIGGYFLADEKLAEAAMRPSVTLNKIINDLASLISCDSLQILYFCILNHSK